MTNFYDTDRWPDEWLYDIPPGPSLADLITQLGRQMGEAYKALYKGLVNIYGQEMIDAIVAAQQANTALKTCVETELPRFPAPKTGPPFDPFAKRGRDRR